MSANSSEPADREQQAGEAGLARFTSAELSRYDGTDAGLPNLIAYRGKVYDVTRSYPWARGVHWGDHRAGEDLTGCMKESIHGEEMLARVPCIGVLVD